MDYSTERSPVLSFDADHVGLRQHWTVHHRGLEYPGEVIVADSPDPAWYEVLQGGLGFRVVFFIVPRRIPARRFADRRIAMAVPARTPDSERRSIDQEIRSVHEARERYAATPDAEAGALRRAMDEREAALRGELEGRYAVSYSQGRVYTHPDVRISPRDVFGDEGLEAWADELASAVLLLAHPTLPIDDSAFPRALDAAGVASLYSGLFHGDAAAASSVAAFGPGLRLTSLAEATRFAPEGCPALDVIDGLLRDGGGEAASEDVLQTLCYNHGLTRPLSLLYLLSFVRHTRAEVELTPGHVVESVRGGPFFSDRITWDLISEVAFSGSLGDQLGVLRSTVSEAWSAAGPYLSQIVGGRSSGTAAEGPSAAQEQALADALEATSASVSRIREAISSLIAGLGRPPRGSEELLERMDVLARSSGYREFLAALREGFDGPAGLGEALARLRSLDALSQVVSEVAGVKAYLEGMTFGRDHRRLALDRDAVAARLDPDGLADSPSLWPSTAEAFARLRGRYAEEYTVHHDRYHHEALTLRNRLDAVRPQVEAVVRFGEMPELGEPLGVDVPEMHKSTYDSLRACRVNGEDLRLEDAPLCLACLLPMDVEIPRREAEEVLGETAAAMREYNRRLSSEAVRQVLARPTGAQVEKFIELVQVADPSALANVLSDDVVRFLRQFLRDR